MAPGRILTCVLWWMQPVPSPYHIFALTEPFRCILGRSLFLCATIECMFLFCFFPLPPVKKAFLVKLWIFGRFQVEVLFCENFLCLLGLRLYFEVLEKQKCQEWDRTCTTTACVVDILSSTSGTPRFLRWLRRYSQHSFPGSRKMPWCWICTSFSRSLTPFALYVVSTRSVCQPRAWTKNTALCSVSWQHVLWLSCNCSGRSKIIWQLSGFLHQRFDRF